MVSIHVFKTCNSTGLESGHVICKKQDVQNSDNKNMRMGSLTYLEGFHGYQNDC
jgi:hypothetical protein